MLLSVKVWQNNRDTVLAWQAFTLYTCDASFLAPADLQAWYYFLRHTTPAELQPQIMARHRRFPVQTLASSRIHNVIQSVMRCHVCRFQRFIALWYSRYLSELNGSDLWDFGANCFCDFSNFNRHKKCHVVVRHPERSLRKLRIMRKVEKILNILQAWSPFLKVLNFSPKHIQLFHKNSMTMFPDVFYVFLKVSVPKVQYCMTLL